MRMGRDTKGLASSQLYLSPVLHGHGQCRKLTGKKLTRATWTWVQPSNEKLGKNKKVDICRVLESYAFLRNWLRDHGTDLAVATCSWALPYQGNKHNGINPAVALSTCFITLGTKLETTFNVNLFVIWKSHREDKTNILYLSHTCTWKGPFWHIGIRKIVSSPHLWI
jgi:hypothetical protein